jgi:hypothetical protein
MLRSGTKSSPITGAGRETCLEAPGLELARSTFFEVASAASTSAIPILLVRSGFCSEPDSASHERFLIKASFKASLTEPPTQHLRCRVKEGVEASPAADLHAAH